MSSVPYQLCPKCNGQGTVSKPPYVAGDVHQWTSASSSYPCDVCNGAKIIPQHTLFKKRSLLRSGVIYWALTLFYFGLAIVTTFTDFMPSKGFTALLMFIIALYLLSEAKSQE